MGNLVGHYAWSSTKRNNTAKVSACGTHTERLLDRSVFISTPETKSIADKNGRVWMREPCARRSKFDYRANKVAFNNAPQIIE